MASCFVLPEGRIEDRYLKNLCALFDSVHIGMPWLMEPTETMTRFSEMGMLEIHQPEAAIPDQLDLSALLKDYRNWVTMNKEQSPSSFIKAALIQEGEEHRWEISQAIKQMNKVNASPAQTEVTTCFLLLHLYQQVREDETSAAQALESIDMSASPLADALGEAADPGTNQIHPTDDIAVPMSEEVLTDVLRAWAFMFGSIAQGVDIAVTPNRQVFDLVVEKFEERVNENIASARPLRIARISVPSCENIPFAQFNSPHGAETRREAARSFSRILNEWVWNGSSHIGEENDKLKERLLLFGGSASQWIRLAVATLSSSAERPAKKNSIYGLLSGKLFITIEQGK